MESNAALGAVVGRPRPTAVRIARYDDDVVGLPKNDPRVVTLSTSERTAAYCPRRWYYGHGLGLGSEPTAAMRYGTAWHACVEDAHRFWMLTAAGVPGGAAEYLPDYVVVCGLCAVRGLSASCPLCGGTGEGSVARVARRWALDALSGAASEEDEDKEPYERRTDRLGRAFDGWLRTYGRLPPAGLDVAAVELAIAAPIRAPGSLTPYAPEVPLALTNTGWRFARPGDAVVRRVRWPWYWIGRLDVVYRSQADRSLIAGEVKSAKAPGELLRLVSVDPQIPGYVCLLDHAIRTGALSGSRASGWWFDVASSSYQYDPEPLKAGGLSLAANRTVPSWRFEATVAAGGHDPAKYAEHVSSLRERIDPKLYLREWGSVGDADREAWRVEAHAIARQVAEHRRDVVEANDDRLALASRFPRRPVCRLPGGHCSFVGPCSADGEQARASFRRSDGATWADPTLPLPLGAPASGSTASPDHEPEF